MCRAAIRRLISRFACTRAWRPSCSRTSTSAPITAARSPSCTISSRGCTMVKHNPLNTLADLAQDNTDKAARELGRLQGLRTQAEQQLSALTQYRQEYR